MTTQVAQSPSVAAQPVGEKPFSGPFPNLPVVRSPHRSLFHYYALCSILLGPAFIIGLIAGYVRYHTMRYEVDEEGITMRWGILFRREISLTYARIQDIHLSSNFLERWLGLAKVQVQTASASAKAEMTIEGLPDAQGIRDFLYSRMRGARDTGAGTRSSVSPGLESETVAELTATLREIAADVRALRGNLPAPKENVSDA